MKNCSLFHYFGLYSIIYFSLIENSIENGSIVSDAFVPTSSLCCSKKINNNCDTNEDVFRLSLVSKSKELDPEIYGGAFLKHVKELLEYKQEYGHLLVPKRYRENPTLGNWVNKTRQQYKHYLNNKPSSMTQERIDLLDKIGFVWSATHNLDDDSLPQIYRQTEISQSWWESYNELTDFVSRQQKESNSNKKIKYPQTSTTLGQWLTSQRRQYQSNKPKTGDRSNNERWDLLFDLLGPDWYKSPRQTKWDQRIKELKEFKQQHGHCMVPISYSKNKSLANWVSTQRKNYNLYMASKPSYMTRERIQELNDLGFVWNRWDFEFDSKQSSILSPEI